MARLLHKLTNKKVSVLTHSYGINVGYQGILEFSPKERGEIFESFVSVLGPWLGSYMPFDYLSGEIWNPLPIDIPTDQYQYMLTRLGVVYTLSPKDTYTRFKDASWVKRTLELSDYYKNNKGKKPFSWMPQRDTLCDEEMRNLPIPEGVPKEMWDTRLGCNFGLSDMRELATVAGKKWDISEIKQFLEKYSSNKDAGILWENFGTYKESAFDNFNVTTYFVVQNNIDTAAQKTFTGTVKNNPRLLNQDGTTRKTIAGDGTVPFMSQLGPAFKWADEFDAKPSQGKPVKIIHYCNDYLI